MFGEVKEEADDDDEDEEGVEAKIDSTLQANVSMRRSVGKYRVSRLMYVYVFSYTIICDRNTVCDCMSLSRLKNFI